MLLKLQANHSSNDIIAKLGNCDFLFKTMNYLKPYLHTYKYSLTHVDMHINIDTCRHQHTFADINEGHVFTVPLFAPLHCHL